MNRFFKRLPLIAKLLTIAILPILFIIYLTFLIYNEKTRNVSQVESYLNRITQAGTLTRLISQLQKERRFSFDYALRKVHQNEMLLARLQTDSLLNELEQRPDHNLLGFRNYTFLENIDTIRNRIDKNSYRANEVMHFYSSAVFRFSTLNRTPYSDNKFLRGIYDEIVCQKILGDQITYLGIINANVYNVLYTKAYTVETLLGTLATYDIYKSYHKEFLAKASPHLQLQYKIIRESKALNSVNGYLNKLFTTYKFDSTYTYESWSNLSDEALTEIGRMQNGLLLSVENHIRSYYNREREAKTRAIIIVVVIIFLLLTLAIYILSIINRTLRELSSAALKISRGESDLKLKPISKDAIGSLTTSIMQIDDKNKELAIAANKIGKGEFQVPVLPRSEEDLLGNAIISMKESLQSFTNDLRHSREEFKKLADFVPQIVWTARPDGVVDYFNRRWYEITGAKQGYGEQSWIPVLHSEDVGISLTAWYRSVETGKPFEIEYRLNDIKSGEFRWFLGRAVPIRNEKGDIIKWFGTGTDIHDQKIKNQNLEELVAQRTVELNRSNEDLQQFAHVASHDLKEPLRKIRTFGDRLSLEFGALLPEKGKIYIDKMQTASARMTDLIESVLRYSVVNATDKAKETIDLNGTIESILNDLELLILQKDAKIYYKNLPKIKAVPTLIYQLFYNLINNALKFSKTNTPALINIRARDLTAAEISEISETSNSKEFVCIEVEDDGIGFNQEYADQMFNVFTRLNTKDSYEGTGLGLALCKKIVHRHHGVIYAKGEEGKGSVFSVILPVL